MALLKSDLGASRAFSGATGGNQTRQEKNIQSGDSLGAAELFTAGFILNKLMSHFNFKVNASLSGKKNMTLLNQMKET